ncbi:MATE family efflux transporter [Aspergillus affinis]|uniref:MATE family efflux transporter n=1 Tax=Aspergillus affinis TaxID=1070780 RepID=UPI0022FE8D21|nr:mate-domain-containing protein [Aspergillus affinis]KAI9035751.1 mate-domain-containing protein [Aspergillus affinis]
MSIARLIPGLTPADAPAQSQVDERSALLDGRRGAAPNNYHHLDSEGGENTKSYHIKELCGNISQLAGGAIPVIITYCLQNSLQTISLAVVGRLSPENLSAAAFSYMFATCTGLLIGLGGTTALDTLASSAFTGGSSQHDLGVLVQRAFFVLGLLYLPVCFLWINSEPILKLLGQEPGLCGDAAKFLTLLIPGGIGYIFFEIMKKYLQAQVLRFGLWGAPLATGLSYWVCFLLLLLYTVCIDGHQCWGGWNKQAFRNIGLFTRLAVLGILHVGAEWWAFEIVAIAAGWLGAIPLASQSVIMSSDQVINTIPFGIGVVTTSLVGNLLGARDARGARRTAQTAIWLSIFLGGIVLLALLAVKDHFAKIFSDDRGVIDLTARVMPYVALFQVADGINGSCSGCLRAMGRQHVGAIINFISYYCSALPLGIWLSRRGYGLVGLWIGQCAALYAAALAQWVLVSLSNWDMEVSRALQRLGDSGQSIDESP